MAHKRPTIKQLSLFEDKPITCQQCGKPVLPSYHKAGGLSLKALPADQWCYGHPSVVVMAEAKTDLVVHCQNLTCGREIFVRKWLPGGGGYGSEFRSADGWCFSCDEARRKAVPKKPRAKRIKMVIE